MNDNRWFYLSWSKLILLLTIGSLTFPVALFSVFNYEINPAFFLAPMCIVAVAKYRKEISSQLFIVMGLIGSLSVILINLSRNDDDYFSNFLSLVLIMFSISFLFVGRMLVEIHGVQKIVKYLAFSSAFFIVISGARLVVSGEPVRVYDDLGFGYMGLNLIGWPLFGDFGVISLASLILIELLVIVTYFVLGNHKVLKKIFLALSIFIASYLAIGSESRSVQVSMFLAMLMLLVGFRRFSIHRSAIVVAVILMFSSSIFSITRPTFTDRTVESTSKFVSSLKNKSDIPTSIDTVSTGRVLLIQDAIRDIRVSPILGTGFDGYGSLGNKASTQNSSTHVYYLTLLWKGGILFFLSYLVLVIGDLRKIFRRGLKGTYIEYRYFLSIPLVLGLTSLAFTWDILAVPSTGALIYFIFGLLRGAKDHELRSVS
jgi:hypothetical protein